MKNGVVKIAAAMNTTDPQVFIYFGRRLNNHGYYPTEASIGRVMDLIRRGVVSFYPNIEKTRIWLVMSRKGY